MRSSVLVASLLLMAGCGGPSSARPAPSATSTPPAPTATETAAFAVPPLHLPSIAPEAQCPTTPREPWSGPGIASAVLGTGPVYPVADYFRDGTALELRIEDREPAGTYSKKVRWIAAGYTGPVLIRTARIDGQGAALVRFSDWGEKRNGGYYANLPTPNSDLPAVTTVSGPGCYAYQVDGRAFTTTIIFRAVAA